MDISNRIECRCLCISFSLHSKHIPNNHTEKNVPLDQSRSTASEISREREKNECGGFRYGIFFSARISRHNALNLRLVNRMCWSAVILIYSCVCLFFFLLRMLKSCGIKAVARIMLWRHLNTEIWWNNCRAVSSEKGGKKRLKSTRLW